MRRWDLYLGCFVCASTVVGCNKAGIPDGSAGVLSMTQESMERTVKSLGTEATGNAGMVRLVYKGVPMILISDAIHDRMRIMAPAAQVSKMTAKQKSAVLEANYHTALDARYAADGDVLYAAFIHPLSSLSEKELRSAVEQVANLASTYGDSYTSGELVFRGKGG